MLTGHLAREHFDSSTQRPERVPLRRQVIGGALVVCGVVADLAAGWLALSRDTSRSLLLHAVAIVVWGIGLALLRRRRIPRSGWAVSDMTAPLEEHGGQRHTHQMNVWTALTSYGWTLVLVLLALVSFPGLVVLVWCLANCFVRTQRVWSRTPSRSRSEDLVAAEEPVEHLERGIPTHATDHTQAMYAEPLVDVIHEPNVELRRGATTVLGKQADRTAVCLLHRLLRDPDPDVRSDASVVLSRLETTFGQAISEAAIHNRTSISATKDYARLCYEYATSDILDALSSRFYLTEAQGVLSEYLTRQPDCEDAWVMLARIHMSLGEQTEALHAINRALDLDSRTLETFLLGAELAFSRRDWETLRALANRAGTALQGGYAGDDSFATMLRWAERQPEADGHEPRTMHAPIAIEAPNEAPRDELLECRQDAM